MNDWINRLGTYLDELESDVTRIDDILASSTVQTTNVDQEGVDHATSELTDALKDLEAKVAERESLLSDPNAPARGGTLTSKLPFSDWPERDAIADRCEQIGEAVALANHRAVSLFVCQYHLSDLSTEILRLMSGTPEPPTYGKDSRETGGGSIFNESA